VNFGLFPLPDELDHRGRPVRGKDRKQAQSRRALTHLEAWLNETA